jgi:hypothetical protein
MILLLALLVIVAIYSGFFSKKEVITHQVVNTDNKVDIMLFETDVKRLSNAINLYYTDKGTNPESTADLIPIYLRTEKESLDPWGTHYRIKIEDEINVLVISAGKDKMFGTSDDLKRRL